MRVKIFYFQLSQLVFIFHFFHKKMLHLIFVSNFEGGWRSCILSFQLVFQISFLYSKILYLFVSLLDNFIIVFHVQFLYTKFLHLFVSNQTTSNNCFSNLIFEQKDLAPDRRAHRPGLYGGSGSGLRVSFFQNHKKTNSSFYIWFTYLI